MHLSRRTKWLFFCSTIGACLATIVWGTVIAITVWLRVRGANEIKAHNLDLPVVTGDISSFLPSRSSEPHEWVDVTDALKRLNVLQHPSVLAVWNELFGHVEASESEQTVLDALMDEPLPPC